ncbi:tRNA (adenine(58)-N(1))-methyltransferase, mitochondrial-like [Ptychodera flava]|uniref:tRNA (adenine(58)-N(1))-methyltransferase, mitochondrial-like n=1 Tax=Ptychodera flava TaxID=63121 RepID=UPI00396AA183
MASKNLCFVRYIVTERFAFQKDFCRKFTRSSIFFSGANNGRDSDDGNTKGDAEKDAKSGNQRTWDDVHHSRIQNPTGGKLNLFELKRRRHRSTLSVFDRVSQMLPPDSDFAVRETDVSSSRSHGVDKDNIGAFKNFGGKNDVSDGREMPRREETYKTHTSSFTDDSVALQMDDGTSSAASDSLDDERGTSFSTNPVEDVPFLAGELAVASRENPKKQEHLRRMFTIHPSETFNSKHGAIRHSDIIGRYPGDNFLSTIGRRISIERATLEDYIVCMKRTPVISYPKDCITMCMLIDANPGDTILEAGSGSGGMTLFLSRAVGPTGHVHAFEINEKHHGRAVKNFNRWQQSWNLSRPNRKWPSNVIFHHQKLQDGDETLGDMMCDGAIIDMENPHLTMPFVARRLKAGRAVAVYLANLTQIIKTLEYIEAKKVPLENARVVEVTHRSWCVIPARRSDGQLVKSVSGDEEETDVSGDDYEELSSDSSSESDEVNTNPVGQVYLAKPAYYQQPHTAFLLKLRKYKRI